MLPFSRILHLFVIKNVVPRSGKRGEAGFLDLALMEHLIKRKRINLPELMIQHMFHAVSRINHDLPYGMSISKVLNHFRVPLCDILQEKNSEMDHFRTAFLKKVELECHEGVWWLGKGATRRRDPVMDVEPALLSRELILWLLSSVDVRSARILELEKDLALARGIIDELHQSQ
ncbi:hypothetical protein Dimus_008426, partial [Dionaea muscipula]